MATGSYFAATSCGADGSNCFVPSYALTTQPLKAISYDAIDAGKTSIRSSLTLGGVTGTLADCSAGNVAGCVTTASYKSMDLSSASAMTDLTSGNFNATIATAANFEFWDSTGTRYQVTGDSDLTAGNVKNGVVIHGFTGGYPSGSYLLANNTGTTDLTLFTTQLTTDGAFEFFDSTGARYTGSGDSDLVAAKVKSGVALENFSITGTWGPAPTAWDIRVGTVINGVTGALKVNCRNRANSSLFDSDSMPPGTAATTAGVVLDYWDTIDDFNNNGAFPTELVNGWTSATDCAKDVWQDMTTGTCDSTAKDCMMKDRVSGLYWSESYPATGAGPASTTANWSNAISRCDALSYGGYSDWRVPTIKELLEAYVHGIRDVAYMGTGTIRPAGDTTANNNFFINDIDADYVWSSTTTSGGTTTAWKSGILNGDTPYGTAKTGTAMVICVR